ncbi:MAG: YidC/Oxa1 family membrane protein insertase [bacterium]
MSIPEIFDVILFNPLFNGLIGLYHIIPGQDLGVAIVLLTLVIKGLLAIPSSKAIMSQRELQQLQPKLEALKKKYKDNKDELGKKLMEFYKEHKVNPLSSCLPTLIQLPIIYILYRVFITGITVDSETSLLVANQLDRLYHGLRTIYETTPLNTVAFGFLHLAETKNIVLALITGALQFWQSRMIMSKKAAIETPGAKDENMAASMSKNMTYFFPIITVWFAYMFPAGLALYWLTSTVFQIGQQYFLFKKSDKKTANVETAKEEPIN